MQDRPESKTNTLYDADFAVWCQEQARLVRERRFDELDIANVAEELETMRRSDKHQIRSRLDVLTAHLLEWRYQPGARKPGWLDTIREQRSRIDMVLEDSPSLRSFPASIALGSYTAAALWPPRKPALISRFSRKTARSRRNRYSIRISCRKRLDFTISRDRDLEHSASIDA